MASSSGARAVGGRGTGTGRSHDGDRDRVGEKAGRTPAQWFCLIAGPVLLLMGLLGFIADASFDTAGSSDGDATGNADGQLQGDGFLGFEVNGWHNVVHVLSGLFLLSIAKRRNTARKGVIAFGVAYGLVALIGLIDGSDVLGLLPVNPADNILHIALTLAALATGLMSRAHHHTDEHHTRGTGTGTGTQSRFSRTGTTTGTTGTDGRTLNPEEHVDTTGRTTTR